MRNPLLKEKPAMPQDKTSQENSSLGENRVVRSSVETPVRTNRKSFPGNKAIREKRDESVEKVASVVDRFTLFVVGDKTQERGELGDVTRGPVRFGMWICIIFFGVFGLWAALAPLDSAAIAIGTVVVDSNKKTIQHLEGGIVSEIMVRAGDEVEAGQPLIRMDETMAQARLGLLKTQIDSTEAAEARLLAERDTLNVITFPEKLLKRSAEPEIAGILDGERRLFETRKKSVAGRLDVLAQRVHQFKDEIQGLQAQKTSTQEQLALTQEETKVVKELLAKGNAQRPRLLALQRKVAELEGQQGEYIALMAKAEQSITEAELEMINLKNTRLNEVVEELQKTQARLSDLRERINASQDVLQRVIVTAPQAGTVTDLKVHTVGGVIQPGAAIMSIIPKNDKLVVEAKIPVTDIDVVHPGLMARVMLTAYKSRNVPALLGEVTYVSADRVESDNRYEPPYYTAKISIDKEALAEIHEITLYPGMSANVLIVTGERTFLGYLFSPISDAVNKSFREQ
ncbi:MAG: prsE [Rickettsiales bacterium]|jgi:HlyD family secretion protein/epimerase transport system membrane fusion protein|nr:prsE [Rickettsiales bacterium]